MVLSGGSTVHNKSQLEAYNGHTVLTKVHLVVLTKVHLSLVAVGTNTSKIIQHILRPSLYKLIRYLI